MSNYTTSQVAEMLGVSASTIRNWLSKFPEKFLLDVHVIKDNGVNHWTEEGFKLLEAHKNGESPAQPVEPIYNLDQDPITQRLLDISAEVRARYILKNLPLATIAKMRKLIANDREVKDSLQSTIYTLTNYQLAPGTYEAEN